jgi:hypothetical protein
MSWNGLRGPLYSGGHRMCKTEDTKRGRVNSTQQCANVDGWCTDRTLFPCAIPGWLFLFALSQPWSQFFFATLFSLRPPPGFIFYLFLLLKLFPPTYYPALSPTDLLTYIFKLNVDSSPSTCSPVLLSSPPTYPTPSIFLPTNILGRYLPNPT